MQPLELGRPTNIQHEIRPRLRDAQLSCISRERRDMIVILPNVFAQLLLIANSPIHRRHVDRCSWLSPFLSPQPYSICTQKHVLIEPCLQPEPIFALSRSDPCTDEDSHAHQSEKKKPDSCPDQTTTLRGDQNAHGDITNARAEIGRVMHSSTEDRRITSQCSADKDGGVLETQLHKSQ